MTTFGISMVRDEADIVEATITNMLNQVDEVIVADNGSVDGTREILNALNVEVVDDPEIGYYQSRKMTALAMRAREQGADWVIPFDADEMWYSPFGTIADVLSGLEDHIFVVPAFLYDHVPTDEDPKDPNPIKRMGWRRANPLPLPKVACRVRPSMTILQGNHSVAYKGDVDSLEGQLIVRHFPYRSAEQFISKARNGAQAYAATDLDYDAGRHWRDYGSLYDSGGPAALTNVFHTWFYKQHPMQDSAMIYDPAPL